MSDRYDSHSKHDIHIVELTMKKQARIKYITMVTFILKDQSNSNMNELTSFKTTMFSFNKSKSEEKKRRGSAH